MPRTNIRLCVTIASILFTAVISIPGLLSLSEAIESTSPADRCGFSVSVVNNTPGYQLEVSLDGDGPVAVACGQTAALSAKQAEGVEAHRLAAKAYTLTLPLGRRQIGKELIITFESAGEVASKGHQRKVFTYKDFFPRLSLPSADAFRTNTPAGLMPVPKERGPATRHLGKDHINDLISWASQEYGLPAALLAAVIEVESAFDTHAVSRKGALGLMQLMPETCERFGVQSAFDPRQNVEGGARYLSYLLHEWSTMFPHHQRLELSLAAYNAGEAKVGQYGGIPPFRETQDYVRQVLKRYKALQQGRTL